MDATQAKWLALSVLWLTTFISSMIPVRLVWKLHETLDHIQHARYTCIIGLLNCFAAGVFMATALLDLFPEVNAALHQANILYYSRSSFPVAEFTISFGFFLVLIIEQLVIDYKERSSGSHHRVINISAESAEPQDAASASLAEQDDSRTANEPKPHSLLRSFLLLLALSFHSLFEGLAIGLQTDVNGVFQIFTAVILHKAIIAFSLGLNLVQTKMSLSSIIKSNMWFSITSPIGISIGTLVEEFGSNLNSSLVNGILQGLACGTFLYVTFFEILPHELGESRHRLLKLIFLLVGFSVVCCVLFLDPSEPAKCVKP